MIYAFCSVLLYHKVVVRLDQSVSSDNGSFTLKMPTRWLLPVYDHKEFNSRNLLNNLHVCVHHTCIVWWDDKSVMPHYEIAKIPTFHTSSAFLPLKLCGCFFFTTFVSVLRVTKAGQRRPFKSTVNSQIQYSSVQWHALF